MQLFELSDNLRGEWVQCKIPVAREAVLLYNEPTSKIFGFYLKLMGKGAEHYEFGN